MPYAFVAAGAGFSTPFGNTHTFSATYAAGETVFLVSAEHGSGSGSTPTMSVSDGTNTYTQVGTFGTTGWIRVWKADNVAGGTFTVTINTGAGINGRWNFFRYTGLASGPVLATTGGSFNPNGTGGSDNVIFPSITPTSQPAMLFTAINKQIDGGSLSAGAGFTGRGISTGGNGLAQDRRLTSTSAVTPTATTTANFEDFQGLSVVVAETVEPTGPGLRQVAAPGAGPTGAGPGLMFSATPGTPPETPRLLAGTPTGTAALAGTLSVGKPLTAAASAVATLAGALGAGKPLGAAASGTAALAGALGVGKPLGGSASATATLGADLITITPVLLAGGAQASATLTGELSVGKPLSVAASGAATLAGALAAGRPLAGGASATAALSGGLLVDKLLAGDATATATLSGNLSVDTSLPVAGGAVATATLAGTLSAGKPLAGAASGTAAGTGALGAGRPLAGTAAASATLAGELRVGKPLAGAVVARATLDGSLRVPEVEPFIPEGAGGPGGGVQIPGLPVERVQPERTALDGRDSPEVAPPRPPLGSDPNNPMSARFRAIVRDDEDVIAAVVALIAADGLED